jgi:RNA-directed DNA polymerase
VSLVTPQQVEKLQETLHAKAKGTPTYRFYALYDKVYRWDVLCHAYACCYRNHGAAGVDDQTFEHIREYGPLKWLRELAEELRKKTYRPQAVRRVWIAKPDGSQRPLGIPTVTDRVVQMAVLLVLEPIFEADLQPEQHAYRQGRNALDAVRSVHALLNTGHTEVVDADLSGYFDSIPHGALMKTVARRIADGSLLGLLKRWLEAPVEERDDRGRRRRTTHNRDQGRGIPQGAPLSPLLANLYMRRFILGWKRLGHEQRLDAHIVNYADDFVICCRGTAHAAMTVVRDMMQKLQLTINETKTRLCRVPDETFNFLGYTLGRCYSPKTGRAYIGTRPSAKTIRAMCSTIREQTSRSWTFLDTEEMIARLNRQLVGWANYFCLGPVKAAYRIVDTHVCFRLRQWLGRKLKVQGTSRSRFSEPYLRRLGLIRLEGRSCKHLWANA